MRAKRGGGIRLGGHGWGPSGSSSTSPFEQEGTMSVRTVAARFVELCNQGKNFDVMRTMYAPDIVSVEGDGRETAGQGAGRGGGGGGRAARGGGGPKKKKGGELAFRQVLPRRDVRRAVFQRGEPG